MLIWGREGWQTMMTGAKDPVTFYINIQSETYGKAKIIKASEDGIVEGITFEVTGNGVSETVTTGANGTVDLELLPGTYLVTERPIDRYVTPASQYILSLIHICMFCMFGLHLEKRPNRFERMALTHPKQYDYCINRMGCGAVLDYLGIPYKSAGGDVDAKG